MRVTSIHVRNFLGSGDPGLEIESFGQREVIVGANGSGKSSLLHAIEFVGRVFKGELQDGRAYVYRGDWSRPIDVAISVELTADDLAALATCLTYGVTLEQSQVNPSWRVGPQGLNRLVRAALSKSPRFFDRLLAEHRIVLRASSYAGLGQPLRASVELRSPWGSLYFARQGPLTTVSSELAGWSQFDLERDILETVSSRNSGLLQADSPDVEKVASAISEAAEAWSPEALVRRLQVKGPVPTALRVDPVPSKGDRSDIDGGDPSLIHLRRTLAERGHQGPGIGPFDVVSCAYNSSFISLSDSRTRPERVPIQAIGIGSGYDPIVTGQNLPLTLFFLKNNLSATWRKRYVEIQEAFERLTKLRFDIGLNPEYETEEPAGISSTERVEPSQPGSVEGQRQVLRHFPYIVFEEADYSYLAQFAASGFLEVLLVLTTTIGPEGFVVLLDEPVLNLHPSKQRELYRFLSREAAKLNNQLLIVTHSNSFVTPEDLAKAIRFDRSGGQSRVRRLASEEPRQNAQTIKELERTPRLLDALFARGVVLVEGGAEAAALPIWFERCKGGELLPGSGIIFADVGGDTHFGALAAILDSWGIPWRIIADQNAASRVERFGGAAMTYPFPDFSDLLRATSIENLRKIVAEVGGSGGDKDPAVARVFASETEPPDSVRELWGKILTFVSPS